MNENKIAIICDSGCDVNQSYVDEHNIFVIPLGVNYPDGCYLSGVDITTDEVVERLDTQIPTTSLPSPILITDILTKVRDLGYSQAIYVGISSGLSGTLQTVELMASSIENFELFAIDTKNIGAGAGLSVMSACEMVEANLDIDTIVEKLEKLVELTSVYFVCKSLEYLHKGGRISDATYKLGSALNIMPIITCTSKGTYLPTKKARGINKALKYQVSMTNSRMKEFDHIRIAICDTKRSECFDEVKALLEARMENKDLSFVRSTVSAALVVHTGPEIVGIAAQPNWKFL